MPRRLGLRTERIEMGPRGLGIDVVRGDRRDAAPVVEPGGEQARIVGGAEVGRCLDVHLAAEGEARGGDGPGQLVVVGLGRVGHGGAGLGAEALDDDLLDVAVAQVQLAQRQQGIDALFSRLANADQQPGRERHLRLTSPRDGLEAHGRALVGRTEMCPAALAEPLGRAFQHDALRHRDLAQRADLLRGEHARIDVRQQRRLAEHQGAHLGEIADRGLVAES